jgi:hypothetical protein
MVKPPAPPVIDGHPAKHSGTANKPPTRVVVHSAVMPCEPGRARQLGTMNSVGSGGGSWHYSVDPDETFQCSYDSYICWHAPPNSHSIGIEMADYPGPVPGDSPGSARWKALKRVWRWRTTNQQKMLRRTAELVAHLCAAYGLPPTYVAASGLVAGQKGWTTHAQVSKAFRQSTHWDPGFWPRWKFGRMVKQHYAALTGAPRRRLSLRRAR